MNLIEAQGPTQLNEDAETAVLGSILLDNDSYHEVKPIVSAKDFYYPRHQIIWQHIEKLISQGIPVDTVTLVNSLRDTDQIDLVGGVAYLVGVGDCVPTSVYSAFYAKIVKEKSVLRQLEMIGRRIVRITQGDTPSGEALDMAGRLLNEVTLNSHDDNSTHLMDGLSERYEMNKTRGSNLRSPGIVYTGIEAFDRICGGFEPGQLIVGGGKTGGGKTVFGQQVGEFESEQGNHSRMHSLEMPREQLLDRAMARRAEVPYFRVRFGKLSPTDEGKVKALSVIPFFIDDRSGLSVDEIVTATQKAHRTNPITLLIVDHIHIVRKRFPNKEVSELGYIADTLKVLARNLNIVVLLLAQLNRASQGKPVLGDLKYSGDIENAADTVLFFHRENYGTSDTQDTRAEIIIAKGRNMELGSIPVSFNGGYQKFANPDKVWK